MTTEKKCVCIVSFGSVDKTIINIISYNISCCFNLSTRIISPLKQPEYAFDERRLQYNAATIIEAMESAYFDNDEKIIGILNQDFSPVWCHHIGKIVLCR